MKQLLALIKAETLLEISPGLLKEAIDRLPALYREVIQLHYFRNLPRKKIALELNCSVSRVNSSITRAQTLLRSDLNPEYFNEMEAIIKKTNQRLLRRCVGTMPK